MSDTGLSDVEQGFLVKQMQIHLMEAASALAEASVVAAAIRRIDVSLAVDPVVQQLRELLAGEGIRA